jgi:cyanophycin synthetase
MSFTDNEGRFELYDCGNASVMLDYGHNPAGIRTALEVCGKLERRRLVGVIGVPGDRQDRAVSLVGRLCAGAFDKIIVKEDADKRGRRDGEIAGLLYAAVTGQRPPDSLGRDIGVLVDAHGDLLDARDVVRFLITAVQRRKRYRCQIRYG